MNSALVACLIAVGALPSIRASETPLISASAHEALTLNGRWHVIVDPCDNGFVKYRLDQFDAVAKPAGGYFIDRKPAVIPASGMTLVSSNADSVGNTRGPRLMDASGSAGRCSLPKA